MAEQLPNPREIEDQTLRFVVDGVYYSLQQNMMDRKQAAKRLKKWFPDAEIVHELPNAEGEDGS